MLRDLSVFFLVQAAAAATKLASDAAQTEAAAAVATKDESDSGRCKQRQFRICALPLVKPPDEPVCSYADVCSMLMTVSGNGTPTAAAIAAAEIAVANAVSAANAAATAAAAVPVESDECPDIAFMSELSRHTGVRYPLLLSLPTFRPRCAVSPPLASCVLPTLHASR